MSGGFKWLECGPWQAIADDAGRIMAHIVIGYQNQPKGPVGAFVDGKFIGNYMTERHARVAVEDFMTSTRRGVSAHASYIDGPMDIDLGAIEHESPYLLTTATTK